MLLCMKSRSRQSRERIAATLASPQGLLAPLNKLHLSRRAKELTELVRTLSRIGTATVQSSIEHVLDGSADYYHIDSESDPRQLLPRANRILAKCHWSPRVSFNPGAPVTYAWKGATEKVDWENRFVFWLLKLHNRGEAVLIRNCRDCGRWFYAVTNHQWHCDQRCRQHLYSTHPNFKEKRRQYMRELRRNEKEKALAAKRLFLGKRQDAKANKKTASLDAKLKRRSRKKD